MRKYLFSSFIIAVLLVLPSCADTDTGGNADASLTIYYCYTEQYQNAGELVGGVSVPLTAGTDVLHKALTSLTEQPEVPGMVSSFPPDVRVYSYTASDGVISLYMTPGYNRMSDVPKAVLKACLTLTLCGLDEIESVQIFSSVPVPAEMWSSGDLLLPGSGPNEYEKHLTVYFSDGNGQFLVSEKHILTVSQDRPLAEYLMDEMMRGPQSEYLRSPLPTGTRVLWVDVKKRLCTVNLSPEFVANMPRSANAERLAVYSIVNSLTALTGVEAVQILINGEKIPAVYCVPMTEPLYRADSIIGPAIPERNESAAVLHYALEGYGDRLIAVPGVIKRDENVPIEHSIAEYLIESEAFYGSVRTIPEGTSLLSATVENRVCTLNLSSEFLRRPKNGLAEATIEASVISAGNADSVVIKVEGVEIYAGREDGVIIIK